MTPGRKTLLVLVTTFMCISGGHLSFAAERPAPDRAELLNIARKFVTRVGGKLDRLKTEQKGSTPSDALTLIPDGETLLFLPRSGNYLYEDNIEAIKQAGGVYFSIEDVIEVLELAIDYDAEKQRARGWYLREDWPVVMDFNQKTVFYRGKNFRIGDNDIYKDETGKIYVNSGALTTWIDMELKIVFAEQYVDIKTPEPLPALARIERKGREISKRDANVARLPRKPIEYDWLDINTADVSMRTNVNRTPEETELTQSGSVAVEGQALKHTAFALASYDKDEHLTGLTARLSKQNEDPVLLGPLKARSYAIGDVQGTNIPLTANPSQQAGFRVSNNPLQNADFQKTTINGDALPGWDVELFRGGVLIGRQEVPGDGRYEFPEVQLYAGDNDFEVVFYGPQGEKRIETLEVPVNADLLRTQDKTYEVSMGLADRRTFEPSGTANDTEDRNSPDIAARYNKYIGDTLGYVGTHIYQTEGQQKAIASTGFTKIWNSVLFDGNFAMDENAEMAAELSARKNIFDWQLAASVLANTEQYAPYGEDNPQTLGLTASVLREFMPPIGQSATFSAVGQYTEAADGTNVSHGNTGLSWQVGRINLSNTMDYTKRAGGTTAPDAEPERLTDTFFARANVGDVTARAGVDYEIKPENQVSQYFVDADYHINPKLTADGSVIHRPVENFTEAEAGLTYVNDKFRLTPYVSYNTDNELQAGTSLNFSLVKPPNELMPKMTSTRLVGRGLVSSFVYHDKNGNNVFDTGDEPLPDVVVESMNIKRRESTDEKGYSLIKDLPNTRATDIHVDDSTLPDPFMISGFEGVSIFPSPGEIVELEFPVHLAGEIDGNVNLLSPEGASEGGDRVSIVMLPIDGKVKKPVETQSAADGYYTASQIPPGTYLMTVTPRSAKRVNAALAAPVIVRINYDGTVLTQDLNMLAGRNNVPISMQMVYGGIPEGLPTYMLKVRQGGKSSLLSVLRRFAMARASRGPFNGLEVVDAKGEKEEGVTYYKLPSNDMAETHRRCQGMVDQGVSCEMMVFVRDRKLSPIKTASVN